MNKKIFFSLSYVTLSSSLRLSLASLQKKTLSLLLIRKRRWSIKSMKLSLTKRSAQIFWSPNRGSTTSEEERKSENIGQQWKSENIGQQRKSVPKIWFHGFFFNNVWIYWWFCMICHCYCLDIVLDLWVFSMYLWFVFFFFTLFLDLIYSYLINLI